MDQSPDPEQKKTGFWTTLPGILTGIAALVTAITGLTMGLLQHGILGSDRAAAAPPKQGEPSARAPAATAAAAPAPTSDAASAPTASPARQAAVIVTLKDGSVTTLLARSFSQTAQYDAQLHLQDGQAIAFDKLASLEVEKVYADHARVKLTLVDGRVLDGSIGAGSSIYGFHGEGELGTFETRVEPLKRIEFRR